MIKGLSKDNSISKIKNIIDKHEDDKHNLLAILLEIQAIVPEQYISKEVAEFISKRLGVSLSRVYDVITFYSALSDKPRGKDVLEEQLSIKVGETTPDGKFTLKYTPCFGACDISPAFRIGDEVFGNLTKEKIKEIISNYGGM
jgi:NADH-quinone oxidoreductase subunit E